MKLKLLFIIFIFIFASCDPLDDDFKYIYNKNMNLIPDNYRLPLQRDIKDLWNDVFTRTLEEPYFKKADLNNDKLFDYIFFLLDKNDTGFGIFCLLSNSSSYDLKEIYINNRELVPQKYLFDFYDNDNRLYLYKDNQLIGTYYYNTVYKEFKKSETEVSGDKP